MSEKKKSAARLFDIRNIIAALLDIYGIILLIAGLAPGIATSGVGNHPHTPDPVDMSVGHSTDIWVGLIMLVIGILFTVWALARPHE
ncbi:hypothetical protein [Tsukamurella soli]|uniref:Uncharacterized protein n=1 Tax=Tsukamurella soli TaxID=644556 RepID=A0ABP8K4V1_9ACTN